MTSSSSFQSFTFSFMSSNMRMTLMFAPPCLGPLREARAAAIQEYVSVPEEVTTWVVKVELLPPPCSA